MCNKSLTKIENNFEATPFVKNISVKGTDDKLSSVSFCVFDRDHKYFNLGKNNCDEETVESDWYLDLLDILREATTIKYSEFSKKYNLHPLQRKNSNIKDCELNEQYDYKEINISKKSRIICFIVDKVLYIKWLDYHHNHYNSEGYGKITLCNRPLSIYEKMYKEIDELKADNSKLNKDLLDFYDYCDNKCKKK